MCPSCFGQLTETTPWTQGVTDSVDPGAQALLGTAMGSALFNAAEAALKKYWVLEPRGSDTVVSLRDRIAMVFTQRVAASWSGPANVNTVNASPTFDAIVADVSLTSRRKNDQELSADNIKTVVFWGLGILAVVVVGMLIFKKRKPAAVAAQTASVPDAEFSGE